jgi:hypothetical protein
MAIDNVTPKRGIEGELRRACADMTALCRGSIGAAIASSQAAFCGAQEVNGELLALLQSRAKDGLVAGQQLAACSSPEALVEVQLEFAKAMLQASADELDRLHALTSKVLVEVMAPLHGRKVTLPEIRPESGTDTFAA